MNKIMLCFKVVVLVVILGVFVVIVIVGEFVVVYDGFYDCFKVVNKGDFQYV